MATLVPLKRYETTTRYDGYSWKPRAETVELLTKASAILDDSPRQMTVRQLYYRLVAGLVIPNSVRSYQNLVTTLTKARKVDLLDAEQFVDRARATEPPKGYADLDAYLEIVEDAYRRKANDRQRHYIEVWTEKDALSAVIGDVIEPYGATLVVSKGYTSYTILVEAAARFREEADIRGDPALCHLLYFGDLDPSGEDIFRVICDEMSALTDFPALDAPEPEVLHIEKVALTPELVDLHSLPPIPTKATDSRTAAYVAEHGDVAVELDALPPADLETIIRDAVEAWFDQDVRDEVLELEADERDEIKRAVERIREARRGGDA